VFAAGYGISYNKSVNKLKIVEIGSIHGIGRSRLQWAFVHNKHDLCHSLLVAQATL